MDFMCVMAICDGEYPIAMLTLKASRPVVPDTSDLNVFTRFVKVNIIIPNNPPKVIYQKAWEIEGIRKFGFSSDDLEEGFQSALLLGLNKIRAKYATDPRMLVGIMEDGLPEMAEEITRFLERFTAPS